MVRVHLLCELRSLDSGSTFFSGYTHTRAPPPPLGSRLWCDIHNMFIVFKTTGKTGCLMAHSKVCVCAKREKKNEHGM